MKTIFIRGESNPNERRAPITPEDAGRLVERGCRVKVSSSRSRIFSDEDYANAGCIVEPGESWRSPAGDTLTVGIKIPALNVQPLFGEHLFFGHQYTRNRVLSEKPTATAMLNALRAGGGIHYDMEFLADESGAKITAFSTVAGYVGAAIGIARACLRVRDAGNGDDAPPYDIPTCTAALRERAAVEIAQTRPLDIGLIGPSGACGAGARELLSALGLTWTPIRHANLNADIGDEDLFAFDLLINCMAVDETTPKILSPSRCPRDARLSVIADIGCETNDNNPVLLRDGLSTLDAPFLARDRGDGRICDILSVDHLPALTPRESSEQVSKQLFPLLDNYISGSELDSPWQNARNIFHSSINKIK